MWKWITLAVAVIAAALLFAIPGCMHTAQLPVSAGTGPEPELPQPTNNLIPTVNVAPAVQWPEDRTPEAAEGLAVNAFAVGLDHPRWLQVLPNGDVLVAETNRQPPPEDSGGLKAWIMGQVMERAGAAVPSADRISILRDADGDGFAEIQQPFLTELISPFGMALIDHTLYVANSDGVVSVPYRTGQLVIDTEPQTVTDLPAELNHHWTKSLIASPDGQYLYAGVGSNSNIAENGMQLEEGRAAVWQINPETGSKRMFASGLRNPVGMAWAPDGRLWVAVNERDMLGGDLVPDYMTAIEDGEFFGWPWSYFGQNVDSRVKPPRPDKVAEAVKPDYALGPHTASLGLHYSADNALGQNFQNGMFVGQHGSWNRKPRSGYKVIFVAFAGAKPADDPIDVLTGFISEDDEAFGRPVGVSTADDGALLVADDVGNVVWRVTQSN